MNKYILKSSIKKRPFFFIIIISIIILIISFINFSAALNTKSEMKNFETSIKLSEYISKLVHELQSERGKSVGLRSANGKRFTDELVSQFKFTNIAIKHLQRALLQDDIKQFNITIHKYLTNSLKELSSINKMREDVLNLNVENKKIFKYYTDINTNLLQTVVVLSKISDKHTLNNMLIAYSNFLQLKETSGLVRAFVTEVLLKGSFENDNQVKLNVLLEASQNYKKSFLKYATVDAKNFFKKKLKANEVKEFAKITICMVNSHKIGGFNIDSRKTLALLDKRLSMLNRVKTYATNHLRIKNPKLKHEVELLSLVTKLIDEIQCEKEKTVSYVKSKEFASLTILNKQQEVTDKQIKKLKKAVKKDAYIDKKIKKRFKRLWHELAKMSNMRKKLGDLSNPQIMIDFYANLNSFNFEVMRLITRDSTTKDETTDLIALYNLLLVKEKATCERILLSSALENNNFSKEKQLIFVKLLTEQNIFLDAFMVSANNNVIVYYKKVMNQKLLKQLNKIRDRFKESKNIGGFKVDPNDWFDLASYKINLFKSVDNYLLDEILEDVKKIINEVTKLVYIYLVIGILTLLLAIGIVVFYFYKENQYKKVIIAKNKKLQERAKELHDALFLDYLTGLGNRNALIHEIKAIYSSSVILVNIDNFSQINDFYGNSFGDVVIKELGNKLKKIISLELGNKLFRLSGDEFIVVCNNELCSNITKLAFDIVDKINNNPLHINNQDIQLGITISISNEDNKNLLPTANMGLKVARDNGKDLLIYDDTISLNDEYKNNIEWVEKIKEAIVEDRIVVFFQPIVNNNDSFITRYEALIRLVEKDGRVISPYFFLDIAKKAKLYKNLTKIVIKKSFEKFMNNRLEISINLTVDDMHSEEIKQYINQMLDKYNIAKRVIFEIVEDESIERFDDILDFITSIKAKGCRIAIDDFGTGYSNFEYLMRLGADFIKIDGSIIKNILVDKNAEIITSLIVSFAKKTNIKVIGEYVENEEIYKKILELGVDKSQGYYFGAPKAELLCNIKE